MHSAAYLRYEKRRKRRKKSKENHNSGPYDVDSHISLQTQAEHWIEELGLSKDDEGVLDQGKWLNDTLIDAGQKLLRKEFDGKFEGLQDLCLT